MARPAPWNCLQLVHSWKWGTCYKERGSTGSREPCRTTLPPPQLSVHRRRAGGQSWNRSWRGSFMSFFCPLASEGEGASKRDSREDLSLYSKDRKYTHNCCFFFFSFKNPLLMQFWNDKSVLVYGKQFLKLENKIFFWSHLLLVMRTHTSFLEGDSPESFWHVLYWSTKSILLKIYLEAFIWQFFTQLSSCIVTACPSAPYSLS